MRCGAVRCGAVRCGTVRYGTVLFYAVLNISSAQLGHVIDPTVLSFFILLVISNYSQYHSQYTHSALTVSSQYHSQYPRAQALAILSGGGLHIQGCVRASKLASKKEKCEFAHNSYHKTLIQLRIVLRSVEYNRVILISDLKVLDDIVAEGPSISSKLSHRYHSKYKNDVE